MEEKERRKLIKYCKEIGFLVQMEPFMKLRTEKQRYERLETLASSGYRIELRGDMVKIVNIFGLVTDDIREELMDAYKYLLKTKELKSLLGGKDD